MKRRKIRWDRVAAIVVVLGLTVGIGLSAIDSHLNPSKHESIVLCMERGHC